MAIGFTAAIIAAALFGSVSTIAKPVLATVDSFLLSSLVYLISAMFFSAIIVLTNNTASASSSSLQNYASFSKSSNFYYWCSDSASLVLIWSQTNISI